MKVQDNKIRISGLDAKMIASSLRGYADDIYNGKECENCKDVEIEVCNGRVYVDCSITYLTSRDIDEIDIERVDAIIYDIAYNNLSGDEITTADYELIKKELL